MIIFTVFGLVLLSVSVVLLIIALRNTSQKSHMEASEQFWKVPAVVTHYNMYVRPNIIIFQYLLPDGSWTEMRKRRFTVGPVPYRAGVNFFVYVSKANPYDVRLDLPSGAGNLRNLLPFLLSGLLFVAALSCLRFAGMLW